MKKTYAEWLNLPPGFEATRFVDGISINRIGAISTGNYSMRVGYIPAPYNRQTKEWWLKQAKDCVAKLTKKP